MHLLWFSGIASMKVIVKYCRSCIPMARVLRQHITHTNTYRICIFVVQWVHSVWICFSFIFQQFYGVFFTHDQIECTLAKWTQRMTVMKWSFVFLLFGCRSLFTCFKSLVNLLLLFLCCSFNGWHFEWYLSRWSTGTSNVQAQIFTHCLNVCVFFICYLLMRHPKEERALQNDAYTTYANTKHIHNILCAHCSLDSYHTVPSNCFDAIIFVVGLYLLYHTNRLKFHFSALVQYTQTHTYWNTHTDVFVYECKWKEITKPCKGLLAH